ncbi:MAG: type II toxin-antitoxin system HicB family antitoxin [Chloroflexi bacterium]|nr:type II toxin-antitoxin system HicB family antitoxin [Chloroflexota bacterium]
MTERRYTILLDPGGETGTYTVTVPALPGVVTQGSSVEEAMMMMAREAIRCHLEGLLKDGEPIPEERAKPRLATVQVAA